MSMPSDPTGTTASSIYKTLPNAVTALENRYADPDFTAGMGQLPTAVQQALRAQDIERMRKGLMPAGADNQLRAGVAAATGQAVTPPKPRDSKNVVGNAIDDLKLLTKSLPQMPKMLWEQVKSIPRFEEKFDENRAAGQNPVEAFFNLPLVQFVPGSYVAGNVAGGNVNELATHPLFTALDILPYASKGAKMTKRFGMAMDEYGALLDAGRYAKKPRPIATALTKRIDIDDTYGQPIATLQPNKLGKAIDRTFQTAPLAKLSDLMGPQVRDLSRTVEIGNQEARDRIMGNLHLGDDPIADTTRRLHAMLDDKALVDEYGFDPARVPEIKRTMTERPDEIRNLPAEEQRYVRDMEDVGRQYADYMVDKGMGLGRFQAEGWARPEYFPAETVARFERAQTALARNRTQFFGGQWEVLAGPKKGTLRPVKGFMDDFERLAAADPTGRFREALDLVNAGDLKAAATKLNRKQNYPTPRVPADTIEVNGQVVKRQAISDKRVGKLISTLDRVAKKEQGFAQMLADTPPARYSDLIKDRAVRSYLDDLETRGVLSDRASAEKWVQQGVISNIPGWDMREFGKHQRGIAETWQKLAAAGEDPIYVPRVATRQAEQVNHPSLTDRVRDPRTAKERIVDFSPSVDSAHVALTYQGFEIVMREVGEKVTREIQDKFGVHESTLRSMVYEEAERMAARDPRVTVLAAQNDLMSRRYMPYDPEKHGVFGGGSLTPAAKDQIWLPRETAKALEAMNKEVQTSIKRLVDPVTSLMRVSLLPLSPRWHLYNIVGGAVMLGSEAGLGAFKPSNIRKTRAVLKAAKAGEPLPAPMAKEVSRLLGYAGREEVELAFGSGGFRRRVFEESQAGRLAKGLIKKSFDTNQHFDDMYRTMGYLYGQDKALTKGMSTAQAQAEGVRIARKVLQDSAAMSPFERNVLRSVFPFYAWLSHVMRFAFNYPMDHPWRAAIVGGFARQVWEDMGDGATLEMMDVLSWGEADENGDRKGLRVASMNPFSDAGNLFTLAGWVGAVNPLGATVLDQLGIDRQSGGPELFPTLRYSAETGQLVAQAPNPFQNLLYNTIPQAQAVARIAGLDAEYQQLKKVNPGAASRMLQSGFGLPVLARAYSPEKVLAKAELKRQEDRTARIAARLKKGDVAGLVKDGVPAETVDLLLQLQASGQLNDLDPDTNPTVQQLVPNPVEG